MASLSIQFHATLDELSDYVEEWMDSYPIHATAVEYQPFAATHVPKSNVREALIRQQVNRLMFTEKAPDCSGSGNNQLLDMNLGALLLDIGRLGPRGLDESSLSTTDLSATWKNVAGRLKRKTKAGALGVHEQTGASAYYRNHRYTAGARALYESGVIMRPFAQSPVVLHLGKYKE